MHLPTYLPTCVLRRALCGVRCAACGVRRAVCGVCGMQPPSCHTRRTPRPLPLGLALDRQVLLPAHLRFLVSRTRYTVVVGQIRCIHVMKCTSSKAAGPQRVACPPPLSPTPTTTHTHLSNHPASPTHPSPRGARRRDTAAHALVLYPGRLTGVGVRLDAMRETGCPSSNVLEAPREIWWMGGVG